MIEVDGLVRKLGDATVLDGLSFVAPTGSDAGCIAGVDIVQDAA